MKATWALPAVFCGAVLMAGGCSRPTAKPANPVSVTARDRRQFPASLAGQWKADRHGWDLILEPDGRIASAVISLGRVKIVPGQTTTVPTRTGEQAVFTPGPWAIDYDPANAILTVKITMEHVRIPMGAHILEGSSTDVFSGVVSPTTGIWQAQWTSFTEYTARTPEGKSTALSTDKTYGDTQPLVFTRTKDQ